MLYTTISARNEMIEDSLKAFPDEACGFMYGNEHADDRYVTVVRRVNNSKDGDKRRRFEINPADYMDAEQYAEVHGLLLLGIYHSHPNHPSVPSEHDRVSAQPYFSYVIISVNDAQFNSLQSWRLNTEFQFEEESVSHSEYINSINK